MRSCALKTILERARISGNALNKVSREVFTRILNYCLDVASGDSLIKVADDKVSAVHGGDPKDYAVLEMLPLFQMVGSFLDREFPGYHFLTANYDHSIVTAIWQLDGQANDLLDTYHQELANRGLSTDAVVPGLRFTTSDVGMSGANLYPSLIIAKRGRIIPLGDPIKTEHTNSADLMHFEGQLALLYARFRETIEKQIKLMDVEIRYPYNTMLGVLKRIKAPKKASFEAADQFSATNGDQPCTAYELYSPSQTPRGNRHRKVWSRRYLYHPYNSAGFQGSAHRPDTGQRDGHKWRHRTDGPRHSRPRQICRPRAGCCAGDAGPHSPSRPADGRA